ncbi:MAG: hypothetical protein F4X40_07045 [Chloroflexi bacterium]|nr:hypothetical protein [Chloroflexota bacterium]
MSNISKHMDGQSWRAIGAALVIAGLLFSALRFIPPASAHGLQDAIALCTPPSIRCDTACDAAGDRKGCRVSCDRKFDQCVEMERSSAAPLAMLCARISVLCESLKSLGWRYSSLECKCPPDMRMR